LIHVKLVVPKEGIGCKVAANKTEKHYHSRMGVQLWIVQVKGVELCSDCGDFSRVSYWRQSPT